MLHTRMWADRDAHVRQTQNEGGKTKYEETHRSMAQHAEAHMFTLSAVVLNPVQDKTEQCKMT